eukprot:sb/3475510/
MRVPPIYQTDPAISRLWTLARSVILREPLAVPSRPLSTPETIVLTSLQDRTLSKISATYKSISVEQIRVMCGYTSRDDVIEAVTSRGWTLEEGEFVRPVRVVKERKEGGGVSLSDLTGYVSFLETM